MKEGRVYEILLDKKKNGKPKFKKGDLVRATDQKNIPVKA